MTEVTVEALGRQGDGTIRIEGEEYFVPYTLAGEVVRISGTGKRRRAEQIITPSPDRIEPVCQHFGSCGGCQLQHMQATAYQQWKVNQLTGSLSRAGIEAETDPLMSFPAASRRKAVFNVARAGGELVFGFAERGSDHIVATETCPVLAPSLAGQLEALRELAASLPLGSKPVRVSALMTGRGCDVDVRGSLKLSQSQRKAVAQKTLGLGFARLSLNGEIVVEPQKPVLAMGMAEVIPPPGAFVQAVEAAESAMVSLVADHLKDCRNVADLYCGIGTFALRLAETSLVLAVEESEAAISALDRAWRQTAGKLKQLRTEIRNLERRPVGFQELKKIDGLVFDPPRAGAQAQARQIARSRVSRVAAVSCNPTTLARDLTILIDGGYRVSRICPIDQFRFTPHLEVVALLER